MLDRKGLDVLVGHFLKEALVLLAEEVQGRGTLETSERLRLANETPRLRSGRCRLRGTGSKRFGFGHPARRRAGPVKSGPYGCLRGDLFGQGSLER